jgi:hypothetical protein
MFSRRIRSSADTFRPPLARCAVLRRYVRTHVGELEPEPEEEEEDDEDEDEEEEEEEEEATVVWWRHCYCLL